MSRGIPFFCFVGVYGNYDDNGDINDDDDDDDDDNQNDDDDRDDKVDSKAFSRGQKLQNDS
jgi:hypothetical protein